MGLFDQTRHQCMTQIHCTDIEAEMKIEVTFDNAPESLDNPNEAVLDDGSDSVSNYIEAVTITEETFENLPDQSNTENVVVIPLWKRNVWSTNRLRQRNFQQIEIDQTEQKNDYTQSSQKPKAKKRASILSCDICGYSCLKKSSLQMHIY